jgi:hypothetical protein
MSASEPDEELPWFRHPLAMVLAGVVSLIAVFAWLNRTRTFEATVQEVTWERTISVERYQLWDKEGWATDVPPLAVDVRDLGDRVHHYDKVLDGYETESYTARVRCGEDCVTVPRQCTEHCASNENGFATCQDVCTGGGQSCSPRYCDEPRTRQVPIYHEEPRYAKFAAYRIWDWGHHRTVKAVGASTTDLRWPEQEARVGLDLAPNEQEREIRDGRYLVSLGYDGSDTISVSVAAEQFSRFLPESRHELVLSWGTVSVDGIVVTRDRGTQ